ncbi:MAG: hypothetical protein N3D16_08555 [Anaerolineales bacterium]|nr:hypothetical protein [Anaerolineales bacterium]
MRRNKNFAILSLAFALLLAVGLWTSVGANGLSRSFSPILAPTPLPVYPSYGENPDLSQPQGSGSIDSLSPTCVNAVPGSGVCYINWYSVHLNVAPSYIVTMTFSIDNRLRANMQGFFQHEISLNHRMFQPGFGVTCGFPKSDSPTALGNTYPYAIRARDSSGANYSNSGQITCPADVIRLYLPLITR